MQNEKTNRRIEYLLRFHESIQTLECQTETHSAGTLNISVVIATVALLGSKQINYKLCYILFPMCVLVVLSIYCYNNHVSAVLRGCLAAVEDILSNLMEKNIFIYNRGYAPLYHIPYFITNDIMGIMYGLIALIGTIYSFYQFFQNSYFHIAFSIFYIIVFIGFGTIYVYELSTNPKIKYRAQLYYHLIYDMQTSSMSMGSFDDFDKEFKTIYKKIIKL